jgi:flagella basal body P-ring formation protein FlgA
MNRLPLLILIWATAAPAITKVENLIQSAVAKQFPAGSRVVVERVRLSHPLSAPVAVSQLLPEPSLGLVSYQVRNGKNEEVTGTAFIRVFAKVAVAKGPMEHKEIFTIKNVSFEERELTAQSLRGFFLDLDSLADKRVRGYVRSGQVLGIQNTESPLAVESGESIELLTVRNGLSISARVRSIDSGKVGDLIRVENQTSKRMLRAKIIAPHTAEVSG